MGHRVVKRVPMDFDAPLNKVWSGYVMPDEIVPPKCKACDGTGESPTARWLHRTWYDHNVADGVGWHDKLHQSEVDALVEAGRLRELRPREPTPDNPRNHEWVTVPRTAEEVNAANGPGASMLGNLNHDSLNCWIAVKARCERLGFSSTCEHCDGRGCIATDAEWEEYENWTGSEPPEGDGWQLWETTSEGSPVTPVFFSAGDLAAFCEVHASPFADMRWTASEWLASFEGGTTDTDTLLIARMPA